MRTLLVREADREVRALLSLALDPTEWRVETLSQARDLIRVIETERPDAVLIDADRSDGADALHAAAAMRSVVVAMTNDVRDQAEVSLIALGADAVYSRPIAPDLLSSRLNATLRCIDKHSDASPARYEYGNLLVDLKEPMVSVAGEPLHLSSTEYRLIRMLAMNAGRILSHDQILLNVWGEGYEGSYELLRTFVSMLRRRLRAAGVSEDLIQTERQLGYWVPREPVPEMMPAVRVGTASQSREAAQQVRVQARLLRERLSTETKSLLSATEQLRVTIQTLVVPGETTDKTT